MLLIAAMILADPTALSLRCVGTVIVAAPAGSTATTAIDNRGNAIAAQSNSTVPAQAILETGFELDDGNARVFLPVEMRPAFSNTKNGWFPVDQLVVGDHTITGKVWLSFMRSTLIEIDRDTGVMTTKHGYRADCAPIDRTKRRF